MKIKIIIPILIFANGFSSAAEPKITVTKEKIAQPMAAAGDQRKPDAVFRIRSTEMNAKQPDLEIPTFSSGMRTRVADVRVSENQIEVAMQVDELGIAYFDYRLDNGKWILTKSKNICKLSGPLALALVQVDILKDGSVDVKYRDGVKERQSSWNDELIDKVERGASGLMSEHYQLSENQFNLIGEPVRLRQATASNTQKSEEQKAQHPKDGASVPDKPKD
jgi:hypothetical protein